MNAVEKPAKFWGYGRPDGSVGIRNHVAIIPTVCLTHPSIPDISSLRSTTQKIPIKGGGETNG